MSTNVTLPDGNSVNLPEYAMDSTMQDIIKVLKEMYKLDGGDTKKLEDLLKQARDDAKRDKDAQKEADKDREKSLEHLRQINESAKKSTLLSTDSLVAGVKAAGAGLMSFASGIGSAASFIMGTIVAGTSNIGNQIRSITDVGVGFDDASGRTVQLISDMQMLGMSMNDAVARIGTFSTAVQVMGKTDFARFTREMANASSFAQQFGLSITESVDLLAEDLELRAQLGVIEQLSAQQQAKNSQELFARQVAASQLLGKSIDKLRGNADAFVKDSLDFQLNFQRLSKMSGGLGASFSDASRALTAELEGAGLDATTAQRIMAGIIDPIAFAANDTELVTAFSALGSAGTDMLGNLQNINKGLNSTDPKVVQAAIDQMGNLKGDFMELSKSMSIKDQEAFISALGRSSPGMEAFFKGMLSMRAASEKVGTNLDGLAQAATVFENSFATFKGAIQGGFTNIMGAFSQPMEALADAFTVGAAARDAEGYLIDQNGKRMTKMQEVFNSVTGKTENMAVAIKDVNELTDEQAANLKRESSIMGVFRDAMKQISDTFKNALGPSTEGLADGIRNYLQPMIQSMADTISGLIERISSADDPIAEIKKIIMEGWENNIKPALIDGINTVVMPALNGIWESIKQGFMDFFTSPAGIGAAIGGLGLILAPLIALVAPVTALGVGITALVAAISGFLASYFFGDSPDEKAMEAAEESGLYDKNLLGKSKIDQEKLEKTKDVDQLKAIIADDDLNEADLAAVKAQLAKIEKDTKTEKTPEETKPQEKQPATPEAKAEAKAASDQVVEELMPDMLKDKKSASTAPLVLASAGNNTDVQPKTSTPASPAKTLEEQAKIAAKSLASDGTLSQGEQDQIMGLGQGNSDLQEAILSQLRQMNVQLVGLNGLTKKIKDSNQSVADSQ